MRPHVRTACVLSFAVLLIVLGSLVVAGCGDAQPVSSGSAGSAQRPSASGGTALKLLRANGRYFTDGSGRAVYLTGSHTWGNLVDFRSPEGDGCRELPTGPFDYGRFLDTLVRYRHNFFRLWVWELTTWLYDCEGASVASPQPWLRTGPGVALDGKPKFDLRRLNQAYFDRLRARVIAAGKRGIYVSIMLFEGWEIQWVRGGWKWNGHPFNAANNINGVEGDVNGDGSGAEAHTLANPAVTAIQDTYVRKVIDTVNDLDNVLYEVANESGAYSTEWQYHIIRLVQRYEARKGKRHPVGMTFQHGGGDNETLFRSPADWISPASLDGLYIDDPPPASGRKVLLLDTDHLCGVCGDSTFVWKSFMRGYNPIYMDPMDGDRTRREARMAMGQTARLAAAIDLRRMRPDGELSSTGFALAAPGEEYVVYQPERGVFTVDLRGVKGTFSARWLHPLTGPRPGTKTVSGGSTVRFVPPFEGSAVLHLEAAGSS